MREHTSGMDVTPDDGLDRSPDAGTSTAAPPFGQYRWNTRTDRWAWSQGMYLLHGYPAKATTPTTELVLQHKDPATRGRAAAILDRARREATSYINHHRIVAATGRSRIVLTVGTSRHLPDGGLVSAGFVADLTEVEDVAGRTAVAAAVGPRTAVNQAQGAIMAVFGLSPDASLALLLWYSQNHNVTMATLCRRLVALFARRSVVADHDELTALVQRAAGADGGQADAAAAPTE